MNTKNIVLRPYQQQALNNIKKLYHEGKRNQLVVWPTGVGKVILKASVAKWMVSQNKKVMVLAHREELLDQAAEKFHRFSDFIIEKEKAELRASDFANVVVASVQSLGTDRSSLRLSRFDPNEFGCLAIDEAHHIGSNSTYLNVINHFRQNKDLLILGVTATPDRADGESLEEAFEVVAHKIEIIDAVRKGYITPVVCHRVSSATSLEGIKTTAGDYNIKELAHVVNNDARNNLILDLFKRNYSQRQAIVFGVNIDHAEQMAKIFNESGIRSAVVTGKTDKEDRSSYIEDFKQKKIQVLFNYAVLVEGLDVEQLDLIIMARPTQSSLLLRQVIGRAFRLFPGKTQSDIVEIVDEHTHKTATTAEIFSFKKTFNCEGHNFLECCNLADYMMTQKEYFPAYNSYSWSDMVKRFQRASLANPTGSANPYEISKDERGNEVINLNDTLMPKYEDGSESKYSFFEIRPNVFKLTLMDKDEGNKFLFLIFRDELGRWVMRLNRKPIRASREAKADTVIQEFHQTRSQALKFAEKVVFQYFKRFDNMLNRKAKWRTEGRKIICSDAQYAQVKRFGLSDLPRNKISKTMACDLITYHYSK